MLNKLHAAACPEKMKVTELLKKKGIPFMHPKGSLPINGHQ
jgi:hypothetical protein